jgi:hypothetical protein
MREKSQIEDMRAALRGDLERARARREADPWREPELRPEVTPGPPHQAEAELQPEPDVVPVPEAEPAPGPDVLPEPEPEPAVPSAPEPEPVAPPEPESEPVAQLEPELPRPGLFARLFGRG